KAEQLPDNWNCYPYPRTTQDIGSAWLKQNKATGLMLSSATSPFASEYIVVVNPAHEDTQAIKLVNTTEKIYSGRIFSRS
ncbi:MAG: hypothetical protein OIF35_06370, partial [Cellvibrionaceae bacterium]|nr:hypothetical protein [Cellvibrionaceae bacterium]